MRKFYNGSKLKQVFLINQCQTSKASESRVLITCDKCICEIKSLSTHHTLAESFVEGSHVEVHSLVDPGPGHWALRVELGLLVSSVLVHQVGSSGAALVGHEVAVDQGGDVVLRVQLETR